MAGWLPVIFPMFLLMTFTFLIVVPKVLEIVRNRLLKVLGDDAMKYLSARVARPHRDFFWGFWRPATVDLKCY